MQNTLKFDVRLIEKNLRRGYLSQKEMDKHLKTLPDVSEKSEKLFADEEPVSETDSEEKR